jgi:regulator of protease activity HflC (stomatin/prohibitin superfamily)
MVGVDGVVFFQVLDAAKAAYEVDNLRLAITQPGDDQHPHRDGVDGPGRARCPSATRSNLACCAWSMRPPPWGIKVTRIEIKDIQPPQDLVDSMARQMKAEREKRANILEAEGLAPPKSCAPRARSSRWCWRPRAARKPRSATPRRASARPRPRPATEMVSEAISAGNVQALNYFVAQKYIEALKALRQFAQPEGVLPARGSHQRHRLDRRHR